MFAWIILCLLLLDDDLAILISVKGDIKGLIHTNDQHIFHFPLVVG